MVATAHPSDPLPLDAEPAPRTERATFALG